MNKTDLIEKNDRYYFPEVKTNKDGTVFMSKFDYTRDDWMFMPYFTVKMPVKVATGKHPNFTTTTEDREVLINLAYQNGIAGVKLVEEHLRNGNKILSFGNMPKTSEYKSILNTLMNAMADTNTLREKLREEIKAEELNKIREEVKQSLSIKGK